MRRLVIAGLLAAAGAGAARAETVADRLLAGYARIRSVSCEIRREQDAGTNQVTWLSRVYYQRPDRLHVDNPVPPPRRIVVADGTNFFSHVAGDRKGFSRPIAGLNAAMLNGLRKVPGTAMDHLLLLRGLAETNLPATAEFPIRRGYAGPNAFMVLSLDASNRLARVEFFSGPDLARRTVQYDYSAFQEVLPGVWIPCLHKCRVTLGDAVSRETTRVNNLVVDQPIPPKMFDPGLFFKQVEFVDRIEKIRE